MLLKREKMTNNIISAILNIVSFKNNNLKSYASRYLNRINAVGEQLEFYTQDAIANSFKLAQTKKKVVHSKVFSYLGNQNNPPDMIINQSDAFEIKKIETPFASIALNSSPPKDILRSSDLRITNACRNCESPIWKEKDIFYVVGYVKKGFIKYLLFIQGTCYAANHSVYDGIHTPIKKEIDSVLDSLNLEKSKTVELGKVKKVDPLGITDLRIRGMWHIKNPLKAFDDLFDYNEEKFSIFVLMKNDKYISYPKKDIKKLESNKEISVQDVKISDPNNPAKLINAKLIKHEQQ